MRWRGVRRGKLRLRFGEQLDQALARFSCMAVEPQEFLIMPDNKADDLRIFRHLKSLPVRGSGASVAAAIT
jgi:hypothetical protein